MAVITGVLVNAALFALRRRWPNEVRPYRAWGYPWSVAVILAANAILAGGFIVDDP
jgi:amino acid transporter